MEDRLCSKLAASALKDGHLQLRLRQRRENAGPAFKDGDIVMQVRRAGTILFLQRSSGLVNEMAGAWHTDQCLEARSWIRATRRP